MFNLNLAARRATHAALALFAITVVSSCDDIAASRIGVAAPQVADASLRSLAVSVGTLTPAFDSATTSYTVAVTAATASITVTPTASSSSSTVAVNGTFVTNGSTSPSIPLGVGSTSVIVVVLASDLTTSRTYTITVVRAAT
ncbi:MAG: cadherin-like beta sandwich domain-containing protein [bacterium]